MAKYYCVLFDADNTLLNFDAAESKALAETLVNYGIALFTGHVQLIFFYKKDRILAFTRSVMVSAAKKDQSPALVLYRMEKMMLPVSSLPRLKESELNALIG